VACLAALGLLAGACAVGPPSAEPAGALGDDAVTVGSFDFAESVLLAELYAQALRGSGIPVVRRLRVGPRELVEPAIERGLLELVPEYEGSLLDVLVGGSSADPFETRVDLEAALARRGLAALDAASAQNQNAFAVTLAFATEHRLTSLSDLAGMEGLVLGGPPECEQRELCRQGLERTYGIQFAEFVPLDTGGPLTTDALARGVVDVALVFSTSAEIARGGLVLLEDDRHLQPSDRITPVVHADALERFGDDLRRVIDAVSAELTTEGLRALNVEMEIAGRSPSAVARGWLVEHGFPTPDG
jgi:osmoprotectant transport system substrate-binding protein